MSVPSARGRRRVALGAGLLILVACALGILRAWWWRPATSGGDGAGPSAWSSPYQNVRSEVRYVGDATCADCHPSHAETYRQHPMGRSLAPVAQSPPLEKYDAAAHNPFESLGFLFAIERGRDGMIHKAMRRDPEGRVVAEVATPIQYVLGSGTRGRSYLLERDGYLFQSPISWFTQQQTWDLSPAFETFYPPERVVEPSCLYCHANRAEAMPQTRNRYRTPIFQGFAIGCERCHGPGEVHVASRERGDVVEGVDYTIVNPRHLTPVLREAVCQQCHLQGLKRIERRGRQASAYRPGLPLHEFFAVFVGTPDQTDLKKAVGQVEQMYASRCFQTSRGKMGCISCHDPHALPAAEGRVDYYRRRCLNCHQDKGCSLSVEMRQPQHDSCMACHMPRTQSADIAHTAVADHRIRRRPDQPDPVLPARRPPYGDLPLMNFFEEELGPNDPESARDFAVALMQLASKARSGRAPLGTVALPLLEKALQRAPEDAVAWEAQGFASSLHGRNADALAAFEAALRIAPEREITLGLVATLTEKMGRPEEAIAYLRRLIQVNPWIWEHHYQLGKLLAQRQEWSAALQECEAALPLNPSNEPTRTLLITCYLRCGRKEQAQRELAKLVALNPQEEPVLRAWFAEQMR